MSVAYVLSRLSRPVLAGGLLTAGLLVLLSTAAQAQSPDLITVVLDQATIAKLPDRVATVVVGNPLIADVSVQSGGQLIVTGKGYGSTNLIALDRSGKVLMEKGISVQGPRDEVVVLYRGAERESYSCAPNCERRIMLGDAPTFFDPTLAQVGSRNARAEGSGGGTPAR